MRLHAITTGFYFCIIFFFSFWYNKIVWWFWNAEKVAKCWRGRKWNRIAWKCSTIFMLNFERIPVASEGHSRYNDDNNREPKTTLTWFGLNSINSGTQAGRSKPQIGYWAEFYLPCDQCAFISKSKSKSLIDILWIILNLLCGDWIKR